MFAILCDVLVAYVVLFFADVRMPGSINGFGLARAVSERWPDIEIVIASAIQQAKPGDMPEKATFIRKPFNARMVHNHLRQKPPDGKKPEPLKQAI